MDDTTDKALAELTSRGQQLGVLLDPEQQKVIGQYCRQLAEYNEHTNLVASAEPAVLMSEHVLDGLTLVKLVADFGSRNHRPEGLKLVDIGSGAGLPGMILAIAVPDLKVTLIDSIGKKVRFLESFIQSAGLADRVRAITGRAEDLAHQKPYRERFDLATARAVGDLELSAELSLPFLRVGGQFFAQKSVAQLPDTMRKATQLLPLLGGRVVETTVLDPRLVGKERAIVVIEKAVASQDRFPRDWVQIKKNPLPGAH